MSHGGHSTRTTLQAMTVDAALSGNRKKKLPQWVSDAVLFGQISFGEGIVYLYGTNGTTEAVSGDVLVQVQTQNPDVSAIVAAQLVEG